jgi:hypothetical protein
MLSSKQLFILGLLAVTTAVGAPQPFSVNPRATTAKNGTVSPPVKKASQGKGVSSLQRISRWCKKEWIGLTVGVFCFAFLLFELAKINSAKNRQVAEELLVKRLNHNRQMSEELLSAVSRENTESVQALIKASVDVSRADVNGYAPLHLATFGNCAEIAETLLQAKADANQVDNQNSTPLYYTADGDHKEVVEILLAHKADINLKDQGCKRPLESAQNQDAERPEEIMKQQATMEQVRPIVRSLMEEFDNGPWNTRLREIEESEARVLADASVEQVSTIVEALTAGWRVVQEAWQKLQLAEDSGCFGYSERLDTQAGGLVVQMRKLIIQMRKDVNTRAERLGLAVLAMANIEKVPKRDPVKEVPKLGAIKELAAEISKDFRTSISTNVAAAVKLRQLSQDVNKCLADCYQRLENTASVLQDYIYGGYFGNVQEHKERLQKIQEVQRSRFHEGAPLEPLESESSGGGCNIM